MAENFTPIASLCWLIEEPNHMEEGSFDFSSKLTQQVLLFKAEARFMSIALSVHKNIINQ
jgi:hypothetical protein